MKKFPQGKAFRGNIPDPVFDIDLFCCRLRTNFPDHLSGIRLSVIVVQADIYGKKAVLPRLSENTGFQERSFSRARRTVNDRLGVMENIARQFGDLVLPAIKYRSVLLFIRSQPQPMDMGIRIHNTVFNCLANAHRAQSCEGYFPNPALPSGLPYEILKRPVSRNHPGLHRRSPPGR